MAKPRVEVKGLTELEFNFVELLKLDAEEGGRAVRSALRAGAKVIADDAKLRVPVDSGELRDALHVSTTKDSSGAIIAGIKFRKVRGGDFPFHWRFVEYGTGPRFRRRRAKGKVVKKLGGATGVMPARPFLRPAFEAKKKAAVKKVQEALAATIKRRMRKLKKLKG